MRTAGRCAGRTSRIGRSGRSLKRAGLPIFKFHELRHTHASLLAAAVPGLNPKVVQERLGHASIDMTLDTYSHLFEGADAGATAALDALDLLRQ
jgi:integrase